MYGKRYSVARTVRAKGKEYEVNPLERDEVEAILAVAPPDFANLIKFAIWTGLRPSEYVALDWKDIDFAKGIIRVRRAMTDDARAKGKAKGEFKGEGEAETTKTLSGRRDVQILAPAREALQAQKKRNPDMSGPVFINPYTGRRWNIKNNIYRNWTKALERASVAYRNPYQTRHTYGSMMISTGENPSWVSRQMGHCDMTVTLKSYARWMPVDTESIGARAIAAFSPSSRKLASVRNAG
ncbi:site-specific integrase [Paraburkholderia sp. 40]|uniref:site-specific integrase n=1 Tax=Paraburkholderia sp. 40 TaxID=2991059 RepID=UPI003D212D93